MTSTNRYFLENVFLAIVIVVSIAGFWNIYLGAGASPTLYHHLHATTSLVWLLLLWCQLRLVGQNQYRTHRKLGLSILIVGPLLVGTTALLSVHSAHKGLVSGQGDVLIVQNVMVTIELAGIILAAFILRRRRQLHGSLLLSTAVLFMGIALVFALTSFVPPFKIEGPETFFRFDTAAAASRYVCLAVGGFFFVRDPRHGWPVLLAGSCFSVNEIIRSVLVARNLIQPLTEFVGSLSQSLVFSGSFAVLCALLAATGLGARGKKLVAPAAAVSRGNVLVE